MHRSPWFRAVAILVAVWFPLVAGEPALLQPCPMHGAGLLVAASLHHSTAPSSAHMHGHHAPQESPAPSTPGHDHHGCTCISCCTASTAILRAPNAPTGEIALNEYVVAQTLPGVASLARPSPEFARPYTTGPPRA